MQLSVNGQVKDYSFRYVATFGILTSIVTSEYGLKVYNDNCNISLHDTKYTVAVLTFYTMHL